MDYISLIIMAIIQGITESFPVSSSAHLLIYTALFAPGTHLMQDVSVQTGTTLAFIVYFRKDIALMIRDWFSYGFSRRQTLHCRLAWYLIIATIPVGLVGLFAGKWITANLHSPWVMACTAFIFGALMGAFDLYARQNRDMSVITRKDALIIGLAQVLALMPGASRSGVTMTAGRALNMNRETAARFSFLLSIPVSVLADIFQAKEALQAGLPVDIVAFSVGMLISGLLAYIGISLFMRWVARIGLMPFAIYRVILGCALVWLIMNGVLV